MGSVPSGSVAALQVRSCVDGTTLGASRKNRIGDVLVEASLAGQVGL
jgi:hypothetical protein